MSWWHDVAASREPDFVIGDKSRPYLRRWWVIPRNRFFNIYLHEILRSDDDRALHDHPWVNMSYILEGSYVEHSILAGGVQRHVRYVAGDVKFRRAKTAHRLEIGEESCWSLFVTGPVIRTWGFHCPGGWRPWQKFVKNGEKGEVGLGCD